MTQSWHKISWACSKAPRLQGSKERLFALWTSVLTNASHTRRDSWPFRPLLSLKLELRPLARIWVSLGEWPRSRKKAKKGQNCFQEKRVVVRVRANWLQFGDFSSFSNKVLRPFRGQSKARARLEQGEMQIRWKKWLGTQGNPERAAAAAGLTWKVLLWTIHEV